MNLLRLIRASQIESELASHEPVEVQCVETVRQVLAEIRSHGEPALKRFAKKFGDWDEGQPLVLARAQTRPSVGEQHTRE